MRMGVIRVKRLGIGYWVSRALILVLVVSTFYPFLMLINMSLKDNVFIQTDFLGLPESIRFDSYANAFGLIIRPVYNSLFVSMISLIGTLILVALSGYAFGRMEFRGKELLYGFVLSILMIPGALLLIPSYWIVYKLGLLGSFLALIFPYIAGQQIFGIILARSFFQALPEDMFEAARIEGAGELYMFLRIAVPLAVPVFISVGITSIISTYNDYVWPTIVLTGDEKKQTFCQLAFNSSSGNGFTDWSLLCAMFVLGSIPLLVISTSCLKYYLQGMLEGAIKG